LKAVFATCVEHLGATTATESLPSNTYTYHSTPQEEILYASTPELASLLHKHWNGAVPGQTRVVNPNESPVDQLGEGMPFLRAGIPEIALITAPTWLLNEFPRDFDERRLVNLEAVERQVASLETVWRIVDGMAVTELGLPPGQGMGPSITCE
jgi:hypothetical protein